LIDWFSSYLKARRQKVVIKNNSSAYCEISAGVPQASVLGPLLFIIYINDIADKLVSLSRLFADDTSFGYSNQDTMFRYTTLNIINMGVPLSIVTKCNT
jgi:hypothetical protein